MKLGVSAKIDRYNSATNVNNAIPDVQKSIDNCRRVWKCMKNSANADTKGF